MSKRIYSVIALVAAILVAGVVLTSLAAPSIAQSTTIQATFSIGAGDAVAPHLYMWYFNGVDAYIMVPYSSTLPTKPWSILGWFSFPSNAPGDRVFVQKNPSTSDYDYGFKLGSSGQERVCFRDTNNNEYCASWNVDIRGTSWRFWTGTYDGTYLKLYDGANIVQSVDTTGISIKTSSTGMSIGYGLNGYSSFYARNVLVYSAAISTTDISNAYSSNIIRSANLVLFLDPTFYNGSHYKDASAGGNVGVVFGGVARVKDSKLWLYLIKGRFTDSYVHFMFFPYGTRISVYDTSNNLVAQFTINGTANNADLVEDYKVSLAAGTYNIVAELPPVSVTTTATQTVTNTVTATATVTETQTLTATVTTTTTVPVTVTETTTSTETLTATATTTVYTTTVETVTATVTNTSTVTTTTVVEVPVTFTSTITSTSFYAVPVYRTATVTETVTAATAGIAAGWAVVMVALSIIGLAVVYLVAGKR